MGAHFPSALFQHPVSHLGVSFRRVRKSKLSSHEWPRKQSNMMPCLLLHLSAFYALLPSSLLSAGSLTHLYNCNWYLLVYLFVTRATACPYALWEKPPLETLLETLWLGLIWSFFPTHLRKVSSSDHGLGTTHPFPRESRAVVPLSSPLHSSFLIWVSFELIFPFLSLFRVFYTSYIL